LRAFGAKCVIGVEVEGRILQYLAWDYKVADVEVLGRLKVSIIEK